MRYAAVTKQASTINPPTTALLDVEGMKCGGCVRSVERTLLDQPGVLEASVNLVTRSAWLSFDGDIDCDLDAVIQALGARGFNAQPRQANAFRASIAADRSWGWWQQWRQLIVALVLLLLSVVGHLAQAGSVYFPPLGSLPFHAGLATVALIGPGRPILLAGWRSARLGVPTMDTLVIEMDFGSFYNL